MAPFQRWRSAASVEQGGALRRPHAGLLRRQRRDLRRAREDLVRQLGGLMVEMYRRGDYRDDLLARLCSQVVAVDDRVAELDTLLATRPRRPRSGEG